MAGSGTDNPAIKANLEKVLAEAQRRMAQSPLLPSFTLSQRSNPALGRARRPRPLRWNLRSRDCDRGCRVPIRRRP